MNARIFLLALCAPGALAAQGFAGLGETPDGFADPVPGGSFTFPADHGAHPAYRIEWWYITANLESADGTPYGLQWTLFRTALAPEGAAQGGSPEGADQMDATQRAVQTDAATDDVGQGWQSPQLWLGHAAVTTPDAHYVAERFARGGIGQAGVTADPFDAWIDDWRLWGPDFDTLQMQATGTDFAYDMVLTAQGPLVAHGQDGYSVKSGEGQASYYYSQPFFAVDGTLILPGGDVAVTGTAWLDREWSSQPLSENQTGWDWFSLSFESGAKLMGFRVREDGAEGFTYASWIEPDGTLTPYADGAFTAQPLAQTTVADREVPTTWRVQLPDRGVDVTVAAINPGAWMDVSLPYWEGPVVVAGSHAGRGYLEMTGYE